MKKNAQVKLESAWWKKNKAKTLKNKGFYDAMVKYEMVRDSLDYAKMKKQLVKLEAARKVALQDCNSVLHKDTKAGLVNYEAIIKLEKHKIEKDEKNYAANQAKAAANGPAPKQKVKKSVTVWSKDIGPDIYAKTKDAAFKKPWACKLSLDLNEDVLDVLEAEDDLTTPAFMVEDAQDIGDALTADIVKVVEKLQSDMEDVDLASRRALASAADKEVKALTVAAKKKLAAVPKNRWAKFAAKKKQYRAYQIKCGAEIAVSAITVTTTVVGGVISGGALGPIAIIGIIRNAYAIAKQIRELMIGADRAGKDFEGDLNRLKASYMNTKGEIKKGKMRAQEFGTTSLKVILGQDVPFLASIPKCESQLDLWDNKVAGVSLKLPNLNKELVKAQKATEGLEKELKKKSGKDAIKIWKKVVAAREALDKALENATNIAGKVRKFDRESPDMKADLEKLKAANGKGLEYFDKIGPVISNIAASAGGFGELSDGLDAATATLEVINVAESTLGTVEGEILNKL